MVIETDLYDTLEVKVDASENEIKKAYNKLSKIWHPDKCPDKSEEEKYTKKFQEINNAKEILLDSEKRNIYDKFGIKGLNPENNPNNFDPFSSMFSSFGGMFNQSSNNSNYEDIIIKLNVSLEDLFNQNNITHTYNYKSYCLDCNGEGTKNKKKNICSVCNGKGIQIKMIKQGFVVQQCVGKCSRCHGSGKIIDPENICKYCKGKTFIIKTKTTQIPLHGGLTNGSKMNIPDEGNQYKNKTTDLIILINEIPHSTFKRIENNLYTEIKLKSYQSLFGFTKLLELLDRTKILLHNESFTKNNTIKKISNYGMTYLHSTVRGDLFIKFIVELPDILTLDPIKQLELKILLQMCDKEEVQIESDIINGNNLPLVKMMDCSYEDYEYINYKEDREDLHDQQESSKHPECVQS